MRQRLEAHGKSLIGNTVHCVVNRLLTDIVGWAISIWIARQLGPADYGIFTLTLWATGLASWLVGMGLTQAITKFIAEHAGRREHDKQGAIVRFVLRIELVLSLVATAVLAFLSTPIADFFFSPSESILFFLAFLGLAPGVLTAVFSSTIEGIQKFEYFTWHNVIVTPFSFAAKIGVILLGHGVTGLLAVMLAFSFINALFYFFVLRKEGIAFWRTGKPLGVKLKARIRRYNASVLAIILTDKVIWDRSENFFLGRLCDAATVGFYNLGFNIVQRFSSFWPSIFWRVLFPAMSNYSGSGDRVKMKRVFYVTTRYLAFIAFPVGIGGAILGYQLIHFLYGHDFIGAQRPLQIMFLASIVTATCNPGAAVLYGYERQGFIFKLGAVMAAVNIVLDILLIKPFGAVGAAVCFAATTAVGSIIGTVYTCRVMSLRFPLMSIAKVLFASIIMGIGMELIILQNHELPGFVLAIMVGSVIYLVTALVLGTFEQEDYTLLQSARSAFPGKSKVVADWLVGLVAQFKSGEG